MEVLDPAANPAVASLSELLRELTGAPSAGEVFASFMCHFARVRPIHALVGFVPATDAPSAAGEPAPFRVTYRVRLRDGEASSEEGDAPYRFAPPSDPSNLPVLRGGFLSTLAAEPRPLILSGVDLSADPVLGDLVRGVRSCMVLPIFQGDKVVEWCASFSRAEGLTGVTDYLNALMTANLVSLAVENRQTLSVVQRLNRRLRDQFDDVARLQQALLPQRTPEIPGLSIATSYLTSDQAGGDYYDFIPLPDGRWVVLIADVSGHGAAAASVMAMLHAIVHGFDPRASDGADPFSPGTLLAYANQRLASAGLEGNFVTAFLGVYDPRSRTLDYASAGHNPPRLRLASGEVRSVDAGGSVPLGVLETIEPPVARVTLGPEDTLVLYTDGIVEAFDERRSMFGLERLDAALRECSGRPDCVIDHVHSALFGHTRSRERDDDQTLVALQATR